MSESTPHNGPPILGRVILNFEELDSTNAEVLRRAEAGAAEGLVVVAQTQTAGRGRSGRRWLDRPGDGLLFSVLLRPRLTPMQAGVLPLAVGLGVAEALREETGIAARVKWPNDVVVVGGDDVPGYRKLVGILVEKAHGAYVVGIGVNVNGTPDDLPPEVAQAVVSISELIGASREPESLLQPILRRCEETYLKLLHGGSAEIIAAFSKLDICLGREVVLHTPAGVTHARAVRIAPNGSLVIEDTEGQEAPVYAADVSLRLA